MGPSYANLFVGFIENNFFSNYHGPKPGLYKRYIDDCFGATSSSREELNLCINSVHSFHPALKYTWEFSENPLGFSTFNFLSTTTVYPLAYITNQLILITTCYIRPLIHNIPFSQFLRLRRLCSDDTDFNNNCEKMCQFFFQKSRLP